MARRTRWSPTVEISAALAFKAVALALLYIAFFGPPHRITVTAERAAHALLDPLPFLRSNAAHE